MNSIKNLVNQVNASKTDYISKLIGDEYINISAYDCYVREKFGVFIPIFDLEKKNDNEHSHPSYEIIIYFDKESEKGRHYLARIISPNILHKSVKNKYCYSVFIEKEYFETRFLKYSDVIIEFNCKEFEFCSDILKALNTFIFEQSKSMMNSDITLGAQTEIITHWLIRSIFGETLDMRAVSTDYSIARAQHYIEQHYMEAITVERLADLGYMSKTTFNRRFKNEIGITPIEYLIEVRIKMAKLMLKRKENAITDIALRCGFGSSSHFSTCFLKNVGIAPTEYRDRYSD